MANFQPRRDHPFTRLGVMQRWWINAQNMLYSNRDCIREGLSQLCKELPRTHEEVDKQKETIKALIEALEMAHGKKKRSEVGDIMRAYLRLQLDTEQKRDFQNQGVRAVTNTLKQLSQEDEHQKGCLTVDRMFTQLLWTWRSVTLEDSGSPSKEYDPRMEAGQSQKALVACAAQIVAEIAATSGFSRPKDLAGGERDSSDKRENSNLRNMKLS